MRRHQHPDPRGHRRTAGGHRGPGPHLRRPPKSRGRRPTGALLAVWLCAAVPAAARAQQGLPSDGAALPPAGFGTLRQDDLALELDTPRLILEIVPLDERVIRLLSPDVYQSLHRLRTSRDAELAERAARFGLTDPTVLLVTFFGRQDRARFEPEDLTVTSQNRLFRPFDIVPLTPLWNGRQLNRRETAAAIYLFEDGIQLFLPLTLSYADVSTDDWERIVRVMDRERASAIARAAREPEQR